VLYPNTCPFVYGLLCTNVSAFMDQVIRYSIKRIDNLRGAEPANYLYLFLLYYCRCTGQLQI